MLKFHHQSDDATGLEQYCSNTKIKMKAPRTQTQTHKSWIVITLDDSKEESNNDDEYVNKLGEVEITNRIETKST